MFLELSFGGAAIKAGAHGLSRGIISAAQGGNFKAGFASGFGASFFSPGTVLGNDTLGEAGGLVARTTIAATVGGTASEIGGGTFANGAVSAAFVHLFNDEYGATIARAQEMRDKGFNVSAVKMGSRENDWQVVDSNSAALYDTLGENAENWYLRDAPVAEAVFSGVKTGAQFGAIGYWGVASLYGAGSSAAISGGLSTFLAGFMYGTESQIGLGTTNIKSFMQQNTLNVNP